MTKQPQTRTAAQASRAFYADPALRMAAEAARHGQDWTQAGRTPVARPAAPKALTGSRQHRAAVAGRPVKALPTARARKLRRKVVRKTDAFLRTTGALFIIGALLMIAYALLAR